MASAAKETRYDMSNMSAMPKIEGDACNGEKISPRLGVHSLKRDIINEMWSESRRVPTTTMTMTMMTMTMTRVAKLLEAHYG